MYEIGTSFLLRIHYICTAISIGIHRLNKALGKNTVYILQILY